MKKLLTNYCFYCILLCSLFTLNVTAQSILNETCDDCCSISNITAQGITCDGENLNIEMIQAEVSGGSGIYGFFVESFIIEEPLETETTNGTITFY